MMMTVMTISAAGGGVAAANGPGPNSSFTRRDIDLQYDFLEYDFLADPPRIGELLNERCVL